MNFSKNNISCFSYDPFGRRILKISKPCTAGVPDANTTWTYTYYVNDASGNVMATYSYDKGASAHTMTLDEQMVYGSSRLGLRDRNKLLSTFTISGSVLTHASADETQRSLGTKRYEYTNHLGNVLLVTTDRKMSKDPNTNGTTDYYHCVVDAYYDYGPFGNVLHDRKNDGYRYGFNGQEKDDELYGVNNATSAEYWIYDARLGRRWDNDPITYPWQSPYAAFNNNPVFYADAKGLEGTGGSGDNTMTWNDGGDNTMTWGDGGDSPSDVGQKVGNITDIAWTNLLGDAYVYGKQLYNDIFSNRFEALATVLVKTQEKIAESKYIKGKEYAFKNGSSDAYYSNKKGKIKTVFNQNGNVRHNGKAKAAATGYKNAQYWRSIGHGMTFWSAWGIYTDYKKEGFSQEVQIKSGIFVFEVAVVDNAMKTPQGFLLGLGYYGIKFIVGEENLIQVIKFSVNTIEEAKENMKKSIEYFKNGNATRDFNSNMERVDDPGTYGIDLSNMGF